MKYFITCLLVLLSVQLILAGRLDDLKWKQYKARHNKHYNQEEDRLRKEIYLRNLEYINEHNRDAQNGRHTYTLGENKFADMTNEEFRRFFNGLHVTSRKLNRTNLLSKLNFDAPETVDWRKHEPKIVGPVKNQAQCGSCWAFSAVSTIESAHALATGEYVSLSEQQLVDCSKSYGNNGCGGGLMDNAFKYVIDAGGLDTEDAYPYDASDRECRFDPKKVGATISSYKDIPQADEGELKKAVAKVGPVSVAIDAGHPSFQLYTDGVYNEEECSEDQLDHGVVVVGYGSENGKDYWLVRNSWGPDWGQHGYIKMSRNAGNQCGIATMASYPIV